MKIQHVLLYRFRPGCDRIEEHLAVIRAFRGQTPGLLDLECGRNVHPSCAAKFTHGFIMTFASKADLDAYNGSERHRKLVEAFKTDVEERAIFDLGVP